MVELIGEVVKSLRIFFFVLLILLCGFGDAFLSLSQVSMGPGQFAGTTYFSSLVYAYVTSLGHFQDSWNFNESA